MPFSNPQFDCYRLILLSASTRRVLLEDAGTRAHLPRVSVPRWTRAAKEITDLIRQRWRLRGIVLDFLGERPGAGSIVIVEIIDCEETRHCPPGYRWVSVEDVDNPDFTDQDRQPIQRLVSEGMTGRGAFSRLGWIEEALDWVSEVTAVNRSQFAGKMEQLNGSANSFLIRFPGEDGYDYWLKAAGSPHAHEGQVTTTLATLFPQYLPEIVGYHEGWNAWLMRDGGTPLSGCDLHEQDRINHVVRRLGELQRISAGHIPELLASGCNDHRMPALRVEILELTPYLEEAMRSQDAETGTRITASRIRRVAALIEEASLRLEDMGIPDALMHCDIDFENVLLGSRGCVFTDWAEASVGNPFVTFEQISVQFAQMGEARSDIPQLRQIYQEVWQDVIPVRDFQWASRLLPLIALVSNLCCRRDWLTTESAHREQSQSYARILARQMDRAAQVIEQGIEACA